MNRSPANSSEPAKAQKVHDGQTDLADVHSLIAQESSCANGLVIDMIFKSMCRGVWFIRSVHLFAPLGCGCHDQSVDAIYDKA